ncbi:hypothetical protein BB558_000014 [Smittium angustum]|uniref:Uncharacterized protein n=1 Tax=Smittium angustum TaxID=133377 RepID=A0A2U1JFC9_SMIAN|nr:hypothetical protein BB558_000014 [Smittium angustum]
MNDLDNPFSNRKSIAPLRRITTLDPSKRRNFNSSRIQTPQKTKSQQSSSKNNPKLNQIPTINNSNDWEESLLDSNPKENEWFSVQENNIVKLNSQEPISQSRTNSSTNSSESQPKIQDIQQLWKTQFLDPVLNQLDTIKAQNDKLEEQLDTKNITLNQLQTNIKNLGQENNKLSTTITKLNEDLDTISQLYQNQSSDTDILKTNVKDLKNLIKSFSLFQTKMFTKWNNLKKKLSIDEFNKIFHSDPTLVSFSLNKEQFINTDESSNEEIETAHFSISDIKAKWNSTLNDYSDILIKAASIINLYNQKEETIQNLINEKENIQVEKAQLLSTIESLKNRNKTLEEKIQQEQLEHNQTQDFLNNAQFRIEELQVKLATGQTNNPKGNTNIPEFNKSGTSILAELDKKRKQAESEKEFLQNQNNNLKTHIKKISAQKKLLQQHVHENSNGSDTSLYEQRLKQLEDELIEAEADRAKLLEKSKDFNEMLSKHNTNTFSGSFSRQKNSVSSRNTGFNNVESSLIRTRALEALLQQSNSLGKKYKEELKTISLIRAKEASLNRSLQSKIDDQSKLNKSLKTTILKLKQELQDEKTKTILDQPATSANIQNKKTINHNISKLQRKKIDEPLQEKNVIVVTNPTNHSFSITKKYYPEVADNSDTKNSGTCPSNSLECGGEGNISKLHNISLAGPERDLIGGRKRRNENHNDSSTKNPKRKKKVDEIVIPSQYEQKEECRQQ